ncbi:uncharacterized protein MELLADRAFT_87539 [Melampsora larici-populina 98AG31]|uniref:Uncharacterized protein n=1 Tax=Melampsora larici-populina (strain 98AG31 / pathotype 3-4-7) TaxID=747676 RepID=F4RNQ1_MELLP|nr:uncharacterized protein MELLADRAFT_87539 [Melampsora larici-populina 98AG31]EGG06056.1 hypothetical protein MELLADRAFT_87539 [Melampsora larici-populina 98AG31]
MFHSLVNNKEPTIAGVSISITMENPCAAAKALQNQANMTQSLIMQQNIPGLAEPGASQRPQDIEPLSVQGQLQQVIGELRTLHAKHSGAGDGAIYQDPTNTSKTLQLTNILLTIWARSIIKGDVGVDLVTPPKTKLFVCTVGGGEPPPTQLTLIDPTPSTSTISIAPSTSGPFDLNDRGVATPPFEHFLDFSKISPANPAHQLV